MSLRPIARTSRSSVLRGDQRAVAGFFEEIPLITIVVVSLSLFLASLFTAYGAYEGSLEALRLRENAADLSESIYSHRMLTGGSSGGRFIGASLTDDVRQKLETEFQPASLGFHYNITVKDVSEYPNRYSWYAGEDPGSRDVRRVTKPVVVIDGDLAHAALLIVEVWRE